MVAAAGCGRLAELVVVVASTELHPVEHNHHLAHTAGVFEVAVVVGGGHGTADGVVVLDAVLLQACLIHTCT